MERITYRMTLDAHKSGIQRMLQGFETADNMARRIEVSLVAGGETYELPENTAALIYITLPDASEPIINDCTIRDNVVVYDVLPITTEGVTEMQIKLIEVSLEGAKRVLVSPRFAVEVSESGTSDEGAEQITQFTSLENAIAQAKAVYDARLTSIEIDEECTFRAYYADGAVYETDVIGEHIRNLTVYVNERVELLDENIAETKEHAQKAIGSAQSASASEKSARASAEEAVKCAEIAVKSTKEQGNFLEWYEDAKQKVSEEAVVQLQEEVDEIKENYVKDNSVGCVAGLKGFYYKAVDRVNKIIYLTKEQCSSPRLYITYAEYNALDADAQKAHYESFDKVADFFAWHNWAKACNDLANPPIEIGGDCTINLEEILKQKESEEKINVI